MEIASIGALLTILAGHCIMLTIIMDRRYSLKATITVWVVFCAVLMGVHFLRQSQVAENQQALGAGYMASMSVFCVVFLLLSKGQLAKRCFSFASYASTFAMLNTISVLLTRIVLQVFSVPDVFTDICKLLICSAFRIALFALYAWVFLRYTNPMFKDWPLSNNNSWWSLALISILFCVIFSTNMVVTASPWAFNQQDIMLFAGFVLLFLSVYYVLFCSIGYMHEIEEKRLVEQNAKYLTTQVDMLQKAENDMRRARHDFRHHNLIIAEYAKAEDTAGILHYLDCYDEDAQRHAIPHFCENNTVNNILCSYAELFGQTKAKFTP